MREIPVVEPGQGKHPDDVETGSHRQSSRRDAHPKYSQAAEVKQDEWRGAEPVDPVSVIRAGDLGGWLRIEPFLKRCQ
jgi:hypothetical protein